MRNGFRQKREVQKQVGLKSPQIPKILCGWHFGRKLWFVTKMFECGLVAKLLHNRPPIEFRCRSIVASQLQLAIGFSV